MFQNEFDAEFADWIDQAPYRDPTEEDCEGIARALAESDWGRFSPDAHMGRRIFLRRANGSGNVPLSTCACGNRTVFLLSTATDLVRACVTCDGAHLWPRFQQAAA
jgi:hypothetical protein